MPGYNPPTEQEPLANLPNTRLTKIERSGIPGASSGSQVILEFTGSLDELNNDNELFAAANLILHTENLYGFGLDFPPPRIVPVKDNDTVAFSRKLIFRKSGL